MTVSVQQTSFVGGEWAPSLFARTDLAKYLTAVRIMKNAYAHPHGGCSNRGGTQFVAEVKDSSKSTRLISFQFSVVQSYILEFGDQYMRVLADGAQVVESSGAGTDIVEAATYKWTASGSGTNEYYMELLAGGDPSISEPLYVYEDVGGTDTTMTEGTLGSLSACEWGYGDNDSLGYSTIYVRLTDGADPDAKADGYLETGNIYEIATPYLEADLSLLKVNQSADVLYITHPSYAPRKLSRTDHDAWTLTTITFGSAISAPTGLACAGGTGNKYAVTAVDADGNESTNSNEVTGAAGNALSWNAVTGADYYKVYRDMYLGGIYGLVGYANTNSFTEPTGRDPDYSHTLLEAQNPFSGADNYPGVSTFFEQRLVLGRTNNYPQTLWGSVVGDFENLNKSTPLQDDDRIKFTINARQVNEIRWFVPLEDLVIGTSGSEWIMSPGSSNDVVTPNSVRMKMQSQWGVSHVQPLVIGNTVVFIEGSGEVVRDLLFNLEVDGYTGNDLTLLANHLFKGYNLTEWCYQQSPDSIIWCIRDDGALLGLTYYREHEVWGWHRHETDGTFESIASISTGEGIDEAYMIVNRTIDGSTKRYIERFIDRLPRNDSFEIDVQDAYFVDCGLSLDIPITITGATKADPVVITAASHGLSDGDYVDIVEVVGMTEINNKRFVVANKDTNTFELQDESGNDIDGSAYTTYISGGKVRKTVTTISGLDHLEAKEVSVLANGSVVSGLTVSSGSITLPYRASRVHIGLGYTSDIETLGFEYQTENGTVQDKKRQIKSVVTRLENTRALWIGPSDDRLNELAFRENENYGEPTSLYTGDKEVFLEAGETREGRLFLRNTDPLPFTLLGIIARMDHGDG